MSKTDEYRKALTELGDWTPFLLKHSGLPGPRGNLELAQVVAEMASEAQVEAWLRMPPEQASENSAQVFLVFCSVTALGKMTARGEGAHFARLRGFASDPRWRVREAVAIALQYVGDADMKVLLRETRDWSTGSWYEMRATAAALAEPRLLKSPADARAALKVLDRITKTIAAAHSPRDESFKVLLQSMGYCWSVAVAALPDSGTSMMEKWFASPNADVRWIMQENLKKSRLERMDAKWVKHWRNALQ